MYTGFDFLGQNIRKFSNGKLLIKPSKDNFKSVLSKIKLIIIRHRGAPTTFRVLEPYAVKVARTVLRRERRGNPPDLSGDT